MIRYLPLVNLPHLVKVFSYAMAMDRNAPSETKRNIETALFTEVFFQAVRRTNRCQHSAFILSYAPDSPVANRLRRLFIIASKKTGIEVKFQKDPETRGRLPNTFQRIRTSKNGGKYIAD